MEEQPVKLIECPRDAWQGLPRQIPTERKVEYLRALIAAGLRHLDAVSFVSPKAVPQMADSEAVLMQLDLPDDIEIIGIVVNEKGAERALNTGKVQTLGYPYSISESFLRRNQNQSPNENRAVLGTIAQSGLDLVVYISMAFGNPYGDAWSRERLLEAAGDLVALGVRELSLADTIGCATTELISEVVAAIRAQHPELEMGLHLHSTHATAAEKVLAAYDAGCRRFDSAMGGLGGCPFAQDELVGNLPTEEVIKALAERGVNYPFDLTEAATLNETISREHRAS
jgi:hydroxymethylglutaryl-CoA lyase